MPSAGLTPEQIERYSRQLVLRGWGAREQQKLFSTSVAIDARLPSAILYLAAAGVGKIAVLGADDLRVAHANAVARRTAALLNHAVLLNPDSKITFGVTAGQSVEHSIVQADDHSAVSIAGDVIETDLLSGTVRVRGEGVCIAFAPVSPTGESRTESARVLAGTLAAALFLQRVVGFSTTPSHFPDRLAANFGCSGV